MRVLAALLALLPACVFAQTVDMPQTVQGDPWRLIVVEMTFDGDDFAYSVPQQLDAFREYTTDPNKVRLRVQYVPPKNGPQSGTFTISAVATKAVDGKAKLSPFKTCLVHIGPVVPDPEPGPGPSPPPGPGPGPEPPPNPPVAGPKNILLLFESSQMTPNLASLRVSLTNVSSPVYKHLLDNQHLVYSLDDDSESSAAARAMANWEPVYRGLEFPVLIVQDQKTGRVIHKQAIPKDASGEIKMTGADVVELLKQSEG